MTKEELSQEIQVHDHFHQMSDDQRVWRQGTLHYQLIQNELKSKFVKTSDRCIFWNKYAPTAAHYRKDYINQLIELGD
jgi:hypothetical protein